MVKPDIVDILHREGIELSRRGRYLWAKCPLHDEHTASFKVDPERQTFRCFGCHEHGDVIAFIMKYKGISFREALSYLGIRDSRPYRPNRQEQRKRDLLNDFRLWCNNYHSCLCGWHRWLQDQKAGVKTEEDLQWIGLYYHAEKVWEHRLDVLEGGDEEAKFKIFKEVVDGNRKL